MSLRISRQFHRWVRDVLRIILNAALAVSIAFALHSLLQGKSKSWNGDDTGLQLPPHNTVAPPSTTEVVELQQDFNENVTTWQAILQDPSLRNFVDLVGRCMPMANIARNLDNPNKTYTIYAPINSAFEGPLRHPVDVESVPFYYLYFTLNHMGPGSVSYEDLKASSTVENSINHDAYFKNLQRISTKGKDGGLLFNHIANYVGRPLVRNEVLRIKKQ